MKRIKLPRKLSDLIELAVRDLSAVERQTKTYRVNMGVWHTPAWNGNKCEVCFAGSVLARSGKFSPSHDVSPYDGMFSYYAKRRLIALDRARVGAFEQALYDLGFSLDRVDKLAPVLSSLKVTSYAKDKKAFKRDLRKAAKVLRGVGL